MTPTPDPSKVPKSQRRDPSANELDYVNILNDSVEEGFEKLTVAQERTELALVQLTSQVRETNKTLDRVGGKLDKLGDRIDSMGDRIDGHLQVAQQQARNIEAQHASIAELKKLCTVLVSKAS